ncbi:MAG: DegT/DnrJ/EryC1/StrS family aminotransferase [Geminicoccaceae bacterium]|nr:MAG: DegT/DnrJ/EryC1/StrS family aminotransferase [Geminicoccaceae bacterium]
MTSPLGLLSGHAARQTVLPIVRPTFPDIISFADDLQHALATGQVTNNGPHVQAFEAELSAYVGTPTLAFSSGQAALMTMLAAVDVRGREVIVPSFTFCATPHAVAWAGGTPVFADVDPRTLTLDLGEVERLITPRTAAILGVCVYGIACDYDGLQALGRCYGVKVLYDSAPAFGTRVAGRPIGGFGDAQIFSFHATKAFATMEGGALITNDPALLARADALRNFGQRQGRAWGAAGLNGKMPEIAAMIGRRQLPHFDDALRRRLEVAVRYRDALGRLPGLAFATPPAGQEPIWLYFPVRIDPHGFGLSRDDVATALAADNVLCRKYFDQPCHLMPAYRNGTSRRLPVTEAWTTDVLALPVYNDQTDEEIGFIVERIEAIHAQAAEVQRHLRATVA